MSWRQMCRWKPTPTNWCATHNRPLDSDGRCEADKELEERMDGKSLAEMLQPPRQNFAGGGMRDVETGKPRFDLLCPQRVPYEHQYLTRCAELMGRGAEHYEDRNWEQFADEAAYDRARSSAFRHFMQWFNGATDEDHAASIFFNVQAAEYVAGRIRGDW